MVSAKRAGSLMVATLMSISGGMRLIEFHVIFKSRFDAPHERFHFSTSIFWVRGFPQPQQKRIRRAANTLRPARAFCLPRALFNVPLGNAAAGIMVPKRAKLVRCLLFGVVGLGFFSALREDILLFAHASWRH